MPLFVVLFVSVIMFDAVLIDLIFVSESTKSESNSSPSINLKISLAETFYCIELAGIDGTDTE